MGEWSGWMLKAAPKVADSDKDNSFARRFRRAASSMFSSLRAHGDFQRRFFVLDGSELRYYRDDSLKVYSGSIDLGTVLEVKHADRQGVPAFSIDLVRSSTTPALHTGQQQWQPVRFRSPSHPIDTLAIHISAAVRVSQRSHLCTPPSIIAGY